MNKYLFGLLLVPALAVTAQAQGQTNARAQAYYHFSKGRLLDDQGQSTQAIDEYKKALEIDPNNSLIYSEMAESYLRNNRFVRLPMQRQRRFNWTATISKRTSS